MMRSIHIAIPEAAAEELERLAERELRRPRDQAALLLIQAVRQAGVERSPRSEEGAEPPIEKRNRSRRASGRDVRRDIPDPTR